MSADCLHVCLHDLACKAHAYYNHLFHVAFYENLKDCHHTRLYRFLYFLANYKREPVCREIKGIHQLFVYRVKVLKVIDFSYGLFEIYVC